ncbi:transient receptor potential cation channel subfamily V member 6-like [Littorina saxatilis]|uniref:transient receptor potential cation channel subfamily V member 6-like n=1 Tax=Littorina saxatilis TaxID=31220 RepID=UPI0038B5D5FB
MSARKASIIAQKAFVLGLEEDPAFNLTKHREHFYGNIKNDCVLQLWAAVHKKHAEHSVLEDMVTLKPDMLLKKRTGIYSGQTALHILVSRGDIKCVKELMRLTKQFEGNDKQDDASDVVEYLLQLCCQVILLKNNASVFDGRIIDGQMILGQAQEHFVLALSIVFFLISLGLFTWEILRIRRGYWYHFDLTHHNGVYRILLVLLAIGLSGDSVWYWAAPDSYSTYFVILALVMGWWFMTFFLRPFRKFSLFTIMLQEVLSGDLIRFSSVIFIVYMSFSTAMYAVFLPNPPKEFDGYDKTMLTMFHLMLGQTNVEILHEASEPWLAVLLFTLFIILTYILMLTAFIALISNTFNAVFNAKVRELSGYG